MMEVMRDVLQLHALLLDVWAERATDLGALDERGEAQRVRIDADLGAVENAAIAAMMRGEESAESLRGLRREPPPTGGTPSRAGSRAPHR